MSFRNKKDAEKWIQSKNFEPRDGVWLTPQDSYEVRPARYRDGWALQGRRAGHLKDKFSRFSDEWMYTYGVADEDGYWSRPPIT